VGTLRFAHPTILAVFVIASEAKQPTLPLLLDGLLRFARNDGYATEKPVSGFGDPS